MNARQDSMYFIIIIVAVLLWMMCDSIVQTLHQVQP